MDTTELLGGFEQVSKRVQGTKNSTCPIALTRDVWCRTSGHLEICNVFILFLPHL